MRMPSNARTAGARPGPGSAGPGRGRRADTRRRARRPRAERWGRSAAACTAGALPALAFPAPALWWFAYVALVPWLLLVRSAGSPRRAAADGWCGGTGFMLAVHHWLLPSLHVFTVVLAALLGALWAPWGALAHHVLGGHVTRRRALGALAVLPSGWLLVELVRSWQALGGPWGMLGASQWQVGWALRLASLGGVWLVSLLVVAVNTAAVVLVCAPSSRAPAAGALLTVAALAQGVWTWAPRPEPAGTARIAVVQPGVVTGADSGERRFARAAALTRSLAGRDLDLVVWGESSVTSGLSLPPRSPAASGPGLPKSPAAPGVPGPLAAAGPVAAARTDLTDRIAALSRRTGAAVLVNVDARRALPDGTSGIFKSSVLVGPHGVVGERYDKMRLVPFGEYVPARALLGWATSVGRAAGENRVRGREQVLMNIAAASSGATDATGGPAKGGGRLRVGPLICFESAFGDMTRQLAANGADLLVVQSSTSSFQHSWAPAQHASLAALRAAETGRSVVHATLTGVSTAFGPGGARVGAPLATDVSGTAVYEVPVAAGDTFYVRYGDWPVHAALLVLAALGTVEGARALRRPVVVRRPSQARTAQGPTVRPGR